MTLAEFLHSTLSDVVLNLAHLLQSKTRKLATSGQFLLWQTQPMRSPKQVPQL